MKNEEDPEQQDSSMQMKIVINNQNQNNAVQAPTKP